MFSSEDPIVLSDSDSDTSTSSASTASTVDPVVINKLKKLKDEVDRLKAEESDSSDISLNFGRKTTLKALPAGNVNPVIIHVCMFNKERKLRRIAARSIRIYKLEFVYKAFNILKKKNSSPIDKLSNYLSRSLGTLFENVALTALNTKLYRLLTDVKRKGGKGRKVLLQKPFVIPSHVVRTTSDFADHIKSKVEKNLI
ncbi:unnamed protein product [Mytilus edulis]|uniref:Uncharacterized protein n=1 Tax=Mytilus edulis TaxID=6550 RepID=A0A8S3SVQ8_MYTED|nr:unnamed protein product [Mytilus edulis]